MRVCFLPGCDKINENWKARPMFTPPKDKFLFEKWVEVLPKKRQLRALDKVCLLHFEDSDVQMTYDTNVNGTTVQIPRDRPKLNPTAIPCRNLIDCDYPKRGRKFGTKLIKKENFDEKKIILKRIKVKKLPIESKFKKIPDQSSQNENIMNRISDENKTEEKNYKKNPIEIENLLSYESDETIKTGIKPFRIESVEIIKQSDKYFKKIYNDFKATQESNTNLDEQTIIISEDIEINQIKNKDNIENNNCNREDINFKIKTNRQIEATEQQKKIFDILYEDIFEVELPSTLWGIHRDPSYKFIAFTYFDPELCVSSKTIILNNNLTIDIKILNKLLQSENLENRSTIEEISVILVEVDNMKICLSDKHLNPLCELKLSESDDNFCKLCLQSRL